MKFHSLLLAGAAALCTAPALAQDADAPVTEDSVFDGDYLTLGIGGALGPSYDGSDDYVVFPLPAFRGSVAGINFEPRQAGIAFDIVPDSDGSRVDFQFGPVARVRFDRHNQIEDPVVELLGKRDIAVEVGPTAGLTINRLLHDYDSLTVNVDLRWDVAGAHKGQVISPGISYFTPLSEGIAIVASLSAEHMSDNYADYYFTVTPAGSAASGLPAFTADGGWKSAGGNIFATVDLDGDLRNGGFGLFFAGGYSRMLEDAKRSPVTSIRGDADQWFGAAGIGYTF